MTWTRAEAKPRYLGRPTLEGTQAQACDLCWRPLEDREYLIAELRAVCLDCLARFSEMETEVNRTIGLVARGFFAEGRPDPGDNGLGGR
jgi:hypothetical protein